MADQRASGDLYAIIRLFWRKRSLRTREPYLRTSQIHSGADVQDSCINWRESSRPKPTAASKRPDDLSMRTVGTEAPMLWIPYLCTRGSDPDFLQK